ncbi:MAG: transglycosylase SLT domain-containing protein [Bacteroidota bacterium]
MVSQSAISSQLDHVRSIGWLEYFRKAATNYHIPLSILLAIASRETGMGTDQFYQDNGFTGKDGHGKGIMQIDDRWHGFASTTAPNDHQANIAYGARYLKRMYDEFGEWKPAIAAYNAGPGNVRYVMGIGQDPDSVTTNGNYAADVLRRSEIIRQQVETKSSMNWPIIGAGLLLGIAVINHYGSSINSRN